MWPDISLVRKHGQQNLQWPMNHQETEQVPNPFHPKCDEDARHMQHMQLGSPS
jgi:hypothetical protein